MEEIKIKRKLVELALDQLSAAQQDYYVQSTQNIIDDLELALSQTLISRSLPPVDPLDDENSEIHKIGREIAEMSDEEFKTNCKSLEKMLKGSNGNDANHLLEPIFDSLPVFYCQHKGAQWNCKHYKLVDKDFYNSETRCRFLGFDNETCISKSCNVEACHQFLNGY